MNSRIKVLGCSGGIGATLRTTSFLLDHDTLIDAGTGVGDLTLEELRQIDQIFLTHSHLDHICSVGFIADAVGSSRRKPLKVYGIRQTLEALRTHIFNNVIWPDFTIIPSVTQPFLSFHEIAPLEKIKLDHRTITALPVNHSIPAVGYAIESGTGAWVFSGDTGPCEELWVQVNQLTSLKHLIIETSFGDAELRLAEISGHLCPQQLLTELKKLSTAEVQVWVSHLKPEDADETMLEITNCFEDAILQPKKLVSGNCLEF